MAVKELRPIRGLTPYYEEIEKRIKKAFRDLLYGPITQIPDAVIRLENAPKSYVEMALASGTITYEDGAFRGRFSSWISKELVAMGAKWDKKTNTFVIPEWKLSTSVKAAVATSSTRFGETLSRIDDQLAKVLPEDIAGSIRTAELFDAALWEVDSKIKGQLRQLKMFKVAASLTPAERDRVSKEWQKNLNIWIKDFTAEEITKLRKAVQDAHFKGNRYENLINIIEKSYRVTKSKARFLARQETSLLVSKFKEVRYNGAGIKEYKWRCVAGSALHPVRPSHKILDGKVFKWEDPPITTAPDEPARRNNPGQDYNCRCYAVPIVRFKE